MSGNNAGIALNRHVLLFARSEHCKRQKAVLSYMTEINVLAADIV
jgi:hypothetical protein